MADSYTRGDPAKLGCYVTDTSQLTAYRHSILDPTGSQLVVAIRLVAVAAGWSWPPIADQQTIFYGR